jgi:hypothetical protein
MTGSITLRLKQVHALDWKPKKDLLAVGVSWLLVLGTHYCESRCRHFLQTVKRSSEQRAVAQVIGGTVYGHGRMPGFVLGIRQYLTKSSIIDLIRACGMTIQCSATNQ